MKWITSKATRVLVGFLLWIPSVQAGKRVSVIHSENFKVWDIGIPDFDFLSPVSTSVKNECFRICGLTGLVPDLNSVGFRLVENNNSEKSPTYLISNLECIENLNLFESLNPCATPFESQVVRNFHLSVASFAPTVKRLVPTEQLLIHPKEEFAPAPCQADEADPQSPNFLAIPPGPKYKILSIIKNTYSRCLKIEKIEEYVKFYDALATQGREVKPSDIVAFLDLINSEKALWIREANSLGKTIRKKYALKDQNAQGGTSQANIAECYITPEGKIIIKYKSNFLGKGASKIATTRIGINGHGEKLGEIEQLVALTQSRDGNFEVEKEYSVYILIKEYKEKYEEFYRQAGTSHPRVIGLTEATLVNISSDKKALIQKRYQHDLTRWQPASFAEKIKVFKTVLTGLDHLHQMGLVHGDLKEANVMMNHPDDLGLSDYGLTYDPRRSISKRGTSTHEAPEVLDRPTVQSSDQVELYQKRDVYAFGIMLMNQIPGFKGNSPSDLCAKFFPGYDRVGVRYKECYLRESKKLYRGLALHAKQTCPASDKESCYYQIAADCLNPDPRLRPSSSGLLKIIPNW